MKTSVIVPYTNNHQMTINFLKHTLPIVASKGYQLVLVRDSKSSVELERDIKQLIQGRSDVIHLVDTPNQGYSIANNRGVAASNGDLLVFINDDVFLQDDSTIETLTAKLLSDDKIGVVQALLLYPNSGSVQTTGHIFGEFHNSHALVNRRSDAPIVQTEAVRQAVSSALYIMRRQTFQSFGGFDERYFNAWDGMDLSLRITESGMTCLYCPTAVGYHIQGGSRETIFRDESYQAAYFWAKHKGLYRCDFQDLVYEQLKALPTFSVSNPVHILNFSSQAFCEWQPLLDLFTAIQSQQWILPHAKNAAIKLEEATFLDELLSYPRIIYLVDNYTHIKNNRYVFSLRDCTADVVIDLAANALPVTEL